MTKSARRKMIPAQQRAELVIQSGKLGPFRLSHYPDCDYRLKARRTGIVKVAGGARVPHVGYGVTTGRLGMLWL